MKIDKKILSGIYNYYNKIYNNKFKIITSTNDELIIQLEEKTFLNYLGFKENVMDKHSSKINFDYLNKYIKKQDRKQKDALINRCLRINELSNLGLNNIHSIIEKDEKVYLLLISENTKPCVELQKISNNDYKVVNIHNVNVADRLINDKKTYISIPVYSKVFNKYRTLVEYELSLNEVDERKFGIKEALYFDLKDEVRKQGQLIKHKDLFRRAPIIKK